MSKRTKSSVPSLFCWVKFVSLGLFLVGCSSNENQNAAERTRLAIAGLWLRKENGVTTQALKFTSDKVVVYMKRLQPNTNQTPLVIDEGVIPYAFALKIVYEEDCLVFELHSEDSDGTQIQRMPIELLQNGKA